MAVDLGDSQLARRLGDFCLSLEEQGLARSVSNVGGFQSSYLAASIDPALSELMSFVHKPLSAFLWRRRRGLPPNCVCRAEDLCIASSPEEIWVNVNRPGHWNQLHEHGPPLLSRAASAIYYPLVEDPSVQPQHDRQSPARFYDGGSGVKVLPRAGLLLLFPTDLLHEVDPVWPGANTRASIAFNLFVRWLDGPMLRAACAGDTVAIQRLAAEGTDVNEQDGVLNFSASHLAAEAGHLSALEVLVALKADMSPITLEGWSPLGLAAAQGHHSVVEYLTTHMSESARTVSGKAVGKPQQLGDPRLPRVGYSGLDGALSVAAARGHQSIVDFLNKNML